MTAFQAAVLGLIQGATEFFPVSSSGHLVLVPTWLGWGTPSLGFDVAVHLGTTISLLVCFAADLRRLVVGGAVLLASWARRQPCPREHVEHGRLAAMVLLGCVPAAVVGVLFADWFERMFTRPGVAAGCLLVTGALLVLGQRWAARLTEEAGERVAWRDAVVIGLAQAVAILPGISRSGATIVAGLGRGLSREFAPRFAFLLAIPAVLGAGVFEAKGLLEPAAQPGTMTAGGLEIALGTVIACLSGILAIKWVLFAVRRGKLVWFAAYCWLVGGASLLWLWLS